MIEASASDCDAVTSAAAEVTVVPDLVITAQPTNDEICVGGTSSTLSVAVDNGTGDITYQWQISTDGTNFSDISGATDGTYTTAALSATTYYQVVVSASASGCDDVTSATATVTVIPDIVITADPTDDTICEGGTSSLSVSITGGAGTISPTNGRLARMVRTLVISQELLMRLTLLML